MNDYNFMSKSIDEEGDSFSLYYKVYYEDADGDDFEGYSISSEIIYQNKSEISVVHKVCTNKHTALTLAKLLCEKLVTPSTLYDNIYDFTVKINSL